MSRLEYVLHGTPRHAAICRALTLANVDLDRVAVGDIAVHRNHIEYDEFQRGKDGNTVIDLRRFAVITKRRVVRNPNPRLAVTR